jgi:hypothetical protein
MTTISAPCFKALNNPTVNCSDIFPEKTDISKISKILVEQLEPDHFTYKFTDDKNTNQLFEEITIRQITKKYFQLSVRKVGSNKIKQFTISDSKIDEFTDKCTKLSQHRESFIASADGIPAAFLVVVQLGAIFFAGTNGIACFRTKTKLEMLQKCVKVAGGVTVAAVIFWFFRRDKRATDADNREADRDLEATILNKHLTVIQACVRNKQEVNQVQLLTIQKSLDVAKL